MASAQAAPKRKAPAAPFSKPNGNARKRAKTHDARALAVQSADAALSAAGELDVAAYVGAREYEIRALEAGMERSKGAMMSRAFQKVPRSLRRRTASHNVKKVPKRLRTRARREVRNYSLLLIKFNPGLQACSRNADVDLSILKDVRR